MLISPVKSIRKPPLIEPVKLGKLSDSANALGNSIQLTNTKAGNLKVLQVLGETVGKKAVFGTATVTITGVASLPFTSGASLTFSGFATTANNKTVTLSSISGLVMTFPAATFTAATELQGTITDGTNTVNIAVSPTDPQTLTSLGGFDYDVRSKNMLRQNQTFPKTSGGITLSYDETTGIYTLNGTCTVNVSFACNATTKWIVAKKGVTYTASVFKISGSMSTQYIQFSTAIANANLNYNDADGKATASVTPTADQILTLWTVYVGGATTITDFKFKLQFEAGTGSDWEMPGTNMPVTIPLKDTSNNQLALAGRVLTYNANGTPATWHGQDQIVKKADGKWYRRKNGEFEADATTRADFWYLLGTPVDTELSAADQTALNSVEKSFAGTTNIMLSDSKGQVYVELDKWSESAMR